jgi:hypothetical protein
MRGQRIYKSHGCARITVMVPFRIVPDIWKGSEGYTRLKRAFVSNCWRSSVGRASDL